MKKILSFMLAFAILISLTSGVFADDFSSSADAADNGSAVDGSATDSHDAAPEPTHKETPVSSSDVQPTDSSSDSPGAQPVPTSVEPTDVTPTGPHNQADPQGQNPVVVDTTPAGPHNSADPQGESPVVVDTTPAGPHSPTDAPSIPCAPGQICFSAEPTGGHHTTDAPCLVEGCPVPIDGGDSTSTGGHHPVDPCAEGACDAPTPSPPSDDGSSSGGGGVPLFTANPLWNFSAPTFSGLPNGEAPTSPSAPAPADAQLTETGTPGTTNTDAPAPVDNAAPAAPATGLTGLISGANAPFLGLAALLIVGGFLYLRRK